MRIEDHREAKARKDLYQPGNIIRNGVDYFLVCNYPTNAIIDGIGLATDVFCLVNLRNDKLFNSAPYETLDMLAFDYSNPDDELIKGRIELSYSIPEKPVSNKDLYQVGNIIEYVNTNEFDGQGYYLVCSTLLDKQYALVNLRTFTIIGTYNSLQEMIIRTAMPTNSLVRGKLVLED